MDYAQVTSIDYAEKIAMQTPLPATWVAGVEMSVSLMEEIVKYGAECARQGYNLAYGQGA